MKRNIIVTISILIILILCIGIIYRVNLYKDKNINQPQNASTEELETLKKLFEENSIIKVYIKNSATTKAIDDLYNNMNTIEYLKNIELVTSLDAYQKMVGQYGEDSELVKSIDKYSLQESIWAGCYYLDDIKLLDEDSYFDKIKLAINKVDKDGIIDNIVTAGIIDIYNKDGMDAVNEYIEKINKEKEFSNKNCNR